MQTTKLCFASEPVLPHTSIFQKFRQLHCETDTKYSRLSQPLTSYVFCYVFHALPVFINFIFTSQQWLFCIHALDY